jgi:alcohol dehydrogenase
METELFGLARKKLYEFKKDTYISGLDCYSRLGDLTAQVGKTVALVVGGAGTQWGTLLREKTIAALTSSGIQIVGEPIDGALPNAPQEDVWRIQKELLQRDAEVVVVVGGGSTLDAAKCANVLSVLGKQYPDLSRYFGMGKVTDMLTQTSKKLKPLVAVAIASASGAHLTKYANITDVKTSQKKLIIDDAVIPDRALFDYAATISMSKGFTSDGALDGISHCLEVFLGLKGEALDRATPVSLLGIELIVKYLKRAFDNPHDLEAREALGLGTDLGGYAIMIGGTNGAHLTSFSLVDILSHGRACALMNPYYTVFFAPAIEDKLRTVGAIFAKYGYIGRDLVKLSGRDLGVAVADGLIALSRSIDFPTTLSEVKGFTDDHIRRALAAAKDPQLESKLKNMPVPLHASQVDEYMGPVLEAAKCGDFSLVKNLI